MDPRHFAVTQPSAVHQYSEEPDVQKQRFQNISMLPNPIARASFVLPNDLCKGQSEQGTDVKVVLRGCLLLGDK